MATGEIPAAATQPLLQAPAQQSPFVDATGRPTSIGMQQLRQTNNFLNGTSRRIPCSASGGNDLVLQPIPGGPLLQGYFDYDAFPFVAPATSTGAGTALLRVPSATTGGTQDLAALPIYKANGATPTGAGDIVSGLQYELTFVDILNGGNGGFVVR